MPPLCGHAGGGQERSESGSSAMEVADRRGWDGGKDLSREISPPPRHYRSHDLTSEGDYVPAKRYTVSSKLKRHGVAQVQPPAREAECRRGAMGPM
eukprot:8624286-Pyramimonas_sp.AAC.1